jgi:RNA polymerase sigma factor (TIGR02999 family)
LGKSWSVDTICATALINESYLKMIGGTPQGFSNRAHFYAIAATAMRQIVINYAEKKQTQKRGGDWLRVTIEDDVFGDEHQLETLTMVNDALDEIAQVDEKLASLVEMRFFAGMTELEIAEVMGITDRTVRRNWKKAKALLMHALAE